MLNCVFCEQQNSLTNGHCQNCGAPLPATGTSHLDEPVFHAHLAQLLAQGQKIQAIAAYQRQTGTGLASAKQAVESLESDSQFRTVRPTADIEWEVGKLLERGEKINATRFYSEQTGIGLQEAKAEVDALELRLGLEPENAVKPAGCFGVIILAAGSVWLTRFGLPSL
jgi:ribosomal protein L7/L12